MCRQLERLGDKRPEPVTERFERITRDAALTELKALVRSTAAAAREGHDLAVKAQEHSEKALVWLTGLMGAGIFSVQGLLVGAPFLPRICILVPWAAGIVCAVLSNLVGGELRNGNDKQYFSRVHTLSLLQDIADPTVVIQALRPLIDSGVLDRDPESRKLNCLLIVVNGLFYLAYIFFTIGVVAAVTTVATLGGR